MRINRYRVESFLKSLPKRKLRKVTRRVKEICHRDWDRTFWNYDYYSLIYNADVLAGIYQSQYEKNMFSEIDKGHWILDENESIKVSVYYDKNGTHWRVYVNNLCLHKVFSRNNHWPAKEIAKAVMFSNRK